MHWGSGRVLEALARFVTGCKLKTSGWRGDAAGESFRRTAFLGSGWVLRRLPALLMDAACCLRMEGRCGGFAAGRNPSSGFAATSLSQGRLWAPAGDAFWGKRVGAGGACPLCRWVLLSAWGWKGGAAASLRGGIPPAALPPPPFHKGGDGLRRAVLLGGRQARKGFVGVGRQRASWRSSSWTAPRGLCIIKPAAFVIGR